MLFKQKSEDCVIGIGIDFWDRRLDPEAPCKKISELLTALLLLLLLIWLFELFTVLLIWFVFDEEADAIDAAPFDEELNLEKAFSKKSKFGGVTGVFEGAQNLNWLKN